MGHLKTKQGGLCALCEKQINLTVMGAKSDYVADHDHISGEIRGVLCRACNGAEGKIANVVATWGKQGYGTERLVQFLTRLTKYLDAGGLGFQYPDHKTAEEKKAFVKLKKDKAAALKAAKLKVRERTTTTQTEGK